MYVLTDLINLTGGILPTYRKSRYVDTNAVFPMGGYRIEEEEKEAHVVVTSLELPMGTG